MSDVNISTIVRARADIADLRRGFKDLSQWLEEHRAEIPHATETRRRVSELALFLERLNAGLEQQDKERAQLLGLFQVSRAVNSTLELDVVLNRAMDTIIQVTHAERGFLMLTDEQGHFASYKAVDPSFHNWFGLALALRNQQIADFPLCNKSFNLSYCGYDL